MLTPKQKATLKSKANRLKPVYQIGKDGLSDKLVDGLLSYLKAHELMKVSILKNSFVSIEDVMNMCDECGIEFVSSIGHVLILYMYSEELEEHVL